MYMKLSLLHVISSLKLEGGGPAQGVRNIISIYPKLNAEPFLLTMDDPKESSLKIDGVKTFGVGRGVGVFSYSKNLAPWLKENACNFDAVIVHGLWQYHGYAVYKALAGTSVPYYVIPHGMLDPWFKSEYPLKHVKKTIYWWFAQYRVLRHAKAVLFTCEEECRLARDSFWPYRVNEKVINYGTTLTNLAKTSKASDFLNRFPDLKDKRLLLFLGRIHIKKGCDLLIEAFSETVRSQPDLHLVMAGPDQTGWQADLEEIADRLGVSEQITWTGMLKREQKWGAIKAAEVFILPSHQENFGISVAEALAVGTPVLISDKVNIWREIQEMRAGLVAEDTLEGTRRLIKGWLSLSPEEKRLIRKNTITCFNKKFDIAQAAKNLVEFIRGSLNNPPNLK